MLTEDEIYGHATGMLNAAGGIYADSVIDFARAIESAVRAELVAASPLTDEQCDEFRRLPGTFNDMVRAIYEAGRASKAAEYADVPPAIDDLAANLAMAVKQLCHALKRHEPDSDTAARAMQYLQKHNLIGSPLR